MALLLLLAVPAHGQSLRQRMIAAEDARVATAAAIAPLLEGLRSADQQTVIRAARGLGRFERPSFVGHLLPLLGDTRPAVRREAAWALGQSLASVPRSGGSAPSELSTATRELLRRLSTERDRSVAGMIADTLGRLPHQSAAVVREVEAALRPWLSEAATFRGIEALIRLNRKLQPPDTATVDALRTAATLVGDPASASQAEVRRLAWLAVNAAEAADLPLIKRGAADPDTQVRRYVVVAIGAVKMSGMERRDWLLSALKDPSFNVRVEAVRVWARTLQATDCVPLITATDDANVHVALTAIDALAAGCQAGPNPRPRLIALAESLPAAATARWQPAAHAMTSLAKLNRDDAAARLPRFIDHPSPFVRAYAARAAGSLGAVARLERLAADASSNVRYEAVLALRQLRGHEADTVYVDALAGGDYQLVLAAAQALEGSAHEAAVPALVQAFVRLSAHRRETSRDSRMALLARLRELGSAKYGQALQACLTDIDPVVAEECSRTLQKWTGVRRTPKPAARTPEAPSDQLPSRARVVMRGGRAFELALLVDEAPASVSRFAGLVKSGYYDGLTFHRVLPNFIIQGGSPGANEYAGDGAFMRDEISGRTHARGTVGVSTRGRDTGDAQIFVNLLDNPRLDRDYTVFAEVTTGLEVIDAVLEGDIIERVEILAAPAAAR